MISLIKKNIFSRCLGTTPDYTGQASRFLREASSRQQKKVFMKSINESIERQKKVIQAAERASN